MIQRIQTIWLFLIAVLSVLLIFMPVAEKINFEFVSAFPIDLLFAVENGLIAVLSIIAIFLYKNRPAQIKLCYTVLFVLIFSCLTIGYDLWTSVGNTEANIVYKIPMSFPILSIVLDILAINAIKKDEKLVRSLDRLR